MESILTKTGVTTLWNKIKSTFFPLSGGTITGDVDIEGARTLKVTNLDVHKINTGIGPYEDWGGDPRLFLGDGEDYDDCHNIYNENIAGICIGDGNSLYGNKNYNVSVVAKDQVGIASGNSIKMFTDGLSAIGTHITITTERKDTDAQGETIMYTAGNYGLRMNGAWAGLSTTYAHLMFPHDYNDSNPYFVSKRPFAIDYTTEDIDGTNDNGDSPTGNTTRCRFYMDKSGTYVGFTDENKYRNNIQFSKGLMRVRVNDTSMLKASQDGTWKTNAANKDNVAVFNNFYVVNPTTNKAGLKVETNADGNMITTIGDKTMTTSDCVQIQYKGHTYALDLIKLEDDGYITQID